MDHILKVAFYKSDCKYVNIGDTIVNKFTGGLGFSHVELVLNVDGKYYQYSSTFVDGGVRRKEHIYDTSVWKYKNFTISHQEYELILDFYNAIMGNKYDILGLLGFIIPVIDRVDKWFCSESCSRALQIIGFKQLMLLESSRISPNKLYSIL